MDDTTTPLANQPLNSTIADLSARLVTLEGNVQSLRKLCIALQFTLAQVETKVTTLEVNQAIERENRHTQMSKLVDLEEELGNLGDTHNAFVAATTEAHGKIDANFKTIRAVQENLACKMDTVTTKAMEMAVKLMGAVTDEFIREKE